MFEGGWDEALWNVARSPLDTESLWTLDPEYQKMLGSWLSLSLPQLKWLCWSPLLIFAGGRKVVCQWVKILSFPVPGWVLNHKYVFVSWFTCFLLFQLGLQFYLEMPKKPLSSVWNDEEETFRVLNYGSNWKYFEKGVAKCKMIKWRREKSRGGREYNRTLGELVRTGWFVCLFIWRAPKLEQAHSYYTILV